MKDIKSYIIRFLTCACLFLIMGQTEADGYWASPKSKGDIVGRYQIDSSGLRLVDTISGETYMVGGTTKKQDWVSAIQFIK